MSDCVTHLNKNNLQLHTANRQNGRGGGLALTCTPHYKKASIEYVTWRVTVKNRQLTVTGIYHPPYSAKNRVTNKNFIDNFTIFTSNLLSEYSNNIIVEDFNLHVSNEDDLDAATFTNICEAFGLYQYITFPTHTSGNCLDLILTELSGNVNVLRRHMGPFLSDHAAVITQLNVKRLNLDRQKKVIRKIKEISTDQWIQAYEDKDLQLSDCMTWTKWSRTLTML